MNDKLFAYLIFLRKLYLFTLLNWFSNQRYRPRELNSVGKDNT